MKLLKPSLLHRVLNVTPGRYPWLGSLKGCGDDGLSLLLLLEILAFPLLLALVSSGWISRPAFWMCIAADLAFMIFLHLPYADRDHWARSRRRRRECIWCGTKYDEEKRPCGECGNKVV